MIATADLDAKLLFAGRWGLEREALRIDRSGALSELGHPAGLAEPEFTRDFGEAQLEIVTAPASSPAEAFRALRRQTVRAAAALAAENDERDELLWPCSMPPPVPDPAAVRLAFPASSDEHRYRRGLARRYGVRKQLISGIHYNFSFDPRLFARFGLDAPAAYFRVLRNLYRRAPFLVYLFGASPFRFDLADGGREPAACRGLLHSLRTGPSGYGGGAAGLPPLRYAGADEYRAYVRAALATAAPAYAAWGKDEQLNDRIAQRESEVYLPLRYRETADGPYIELRLFDVDPSLAWGIDEAGLRFVHLAILEALLDDSPPFDEEAWAAAGRAIASASLCARSSDGRPPAFLRRPLAAYFDSLSGLLERYAPADAADYRSALAAFRRRGLEGPTPAARMAKDAAAFPGGRLAWALSLAEAHRLAAERAGVEDALDGLELSTQLLVREAWRRGARVELLDGADNFIRVSASGRSVLVKQATKTGADTYVGALAMENKSVTKRLLREAGVRTPAGVELAPDEDAAAAAARLAGVAWAPAGLVVKPKSTNFGLGVAVLDADAGARVIEAAIRSARRHDPATLVEERIPGTELRFLVIGGVARAVLERIPAQVVGDGASTVRALVAAKNRDPRRGAGYRFPMEKIKLGRIEVGRLAADGLGPDSVPAAGRVVALRKNSNISTGGEGVDRTDEVHPGYLELAGRAAAAAGAAICGVDILIADYRLAPTPDGYGVIELNFNPALHIHAFPATGTGGAVEGWVLDLLGFPAAAKE
jgi:glutamate--cysteine ligase